jgi:hypothetical protein
MLSELVKKIASNNTDSKASVNKYGIAPTDQGQNFSQSSEGEFRDLLLVF